MLRSTRGLLLLAILVILVAVGTAYYRQRKTLAHQAPTPPKSLPLNMDAAASDWVWSKDEGGRHVAEIRAKQFRQVTDLGRIELDNVELRLYKGDEYHLVRSARAHFDQNQATLYSDGEVNITMGMPAEGKPAGRLLNIRSSGVTFDSKTGKASTDRPASFTFDQGDGKAIGASYDPNLRELIMKSQVELNWRGRGPKSRPMKLEAGELIYKEAESYVLLEPWSRLTRGDTVLEGGEAVVTLKDGAIEKAEARQAHGTDRYPARQLEYAADQLRMNFSPEGEVEKIVGERNARLVATSDAARTTVTSNNVELDFDLSSGASALRKAIAVGNTSMESAPVPRQGVLAPETRKLHSEVVHLTMRPGGREIETVETQAPGRLEFLPNRAGQRHRILDAERMTITYGPENQVQSFRAVNAATRTEPERKDPKKDPGPPLETSSKDLAAEFDPKTGQLARLEQWNDFRYQEGERKGRARRAILEEARNLITLQEDARVWDPAGSASAERILLDQKTGDLDAQGRVVSTRMPDRKGKSSAMLSTDQPLEATADRMQTTNHNQKIHYEGNAVAWQGANRIQADVIDIDRTERRLAARGNVRTQLVDSPKNDSKTRKQAAPAIIHITAAALVYTEADRMAHYTGGTHLTRPGMDIRAAEIRAWLNEPNAETSLDHAFADGKVQIVRTEPGRTRTGTGEHAEYYAADQRVVLAGGQPQLVDSLRGYTRGQELTYYADNDKLLVNGVEQQPVKSLIRRR